jgi:3-hydroxyisobutyrate dehydrogenase-like beta-hydroxyacid dehydrogenase
METIVTEKTYGFVGVGHMGEPMSIRLLKAGMKVVAYDVDEKAVVALVNAGAEKADSPAAVVDRVDTVFLSLPNGDIVKKVALGTNGLVKGSGAKTVVDFSTIGSRAATEIAKGLSEAGLAYVDAPVSGGVPGARAGSLAVMVSCPDALFTALQPVLSTFGKVFHVGKEAGQAQTMKLANNLLSAAAIAVSSEAMVMGAKAGLDPKVMLDVINAGSGRNSATQDKFPRSVLPGTFDYGFGTGLAYKDVRLCIDEAESLGVPMVVGAAVRQMLAVTNAVYGEASDYTSLCKVVESWAGVAVRG